MIELTKEHLVYMNLGQRFWGADIESLTEDQKRALREYVPHFKDAIRKGLGLFLWGPNSTGKSYVSAALVKEAWKQWRVTGYCTTAAELKDCWIEDAPAHPGSEETVTRRALTSRLLVIDDMGKEHRAASGFAENRFGALLRARSRAVKTTIITTNLNPKEFGEVYGTSTAQLSKECMYPAQLSGVDMRGLVAAKNQRFVEGK